MYSQSKLIIIIFFVLLFYCFPSRPAKIKEKQFDAETLNSIQSKEQEKISVNRWGIVNQNRLRFRKKPDLSAEIIQYFDKGVLVKIIGATIRKARINGIEDYWYMVEYNFTQGWIYSYYVDSFPNKELAMEQQKILLKNESKNSKTKTLIDNLIRKKINNYLYFIDNDRLVKIVDYNQKKWQVINKSVKISDFFLIPKSKNLFFITERRKKLYLHITEKKKNLLIKYDVEAGCVHPEKPILAFVKKNKSNLKNEIIWDIFTHNYETTKKPEFLTAIKIIKNEQNVNDNFSMTILKEKGTNSQITWNAEPELIFFKPGGLPQLFIISLKDGNYMKTNFQEKNELSLADGNYISRETRFDPDKQQEYLIMLNNKFSGEEKIIFRSHKIPIGFAANNDLNLISFSLLDIVKTADNKEKILSNLFVIYLANNQVIPLTEHGTCRHARWEEY